MDLAFPRTVTRSRFEIDYPPVHYYMVHQSIFDLGATTGDEDRITLNVYDRTHCLRLFEGVVGFEAMKAESTATGILRSQIRSLTKKKQ